MDIGMRNMFTWMSGPLAFQLACLPVSHLASFPAVNPLSLSGL